MAEPLKNMYNEELVNSIASTTLSHYPGFKHDQFISQVLNKEWEARELKDRMRTLSTQLYQAIDLPFAKCAEVILEVAPECKRGFENIIFPDLIEVFGQDDWNTSIQALKKLTHLSSSEFAIRPFIIKYPEKTLSEMLTWTLDSDEHIRRLASEGCRPRLPWAMALPALKKDPTPILPILENLKADESLYVRKSVANNLNDISKDHPGLVLQIASDWQGNHSHSDWIIKHALRTLLKAGDTKALRLFGFQDPEKIKINKLELSDDKPGIGDDLHFSFDLNIPSASKLRLEYAITYAKKNGASRKVFQLSEKEHDAGTVNIRRKQSLADMSTRKHYPGEHSIDIVVNGEVKATSQFELQNPK